MTKNDKIKILIVDDNPADLLFLTDIIEEDTSLETNILEAKNIKEAGSIIKHENVDIVFLDLFLPDSSGFETFKYINGIKLDLNIIVLSGLQDEEIALKTVKSGAQDFILKGEYNGKLIEKTIIYSIERKKNEELLRYSNQKYIELFQNSPLSLLIVDPEKNMIRQSNRAATDLFGYEPQQFIKLEYSQLFLTENVFNGKKYFVAKKKDNNTIFVHVVKQEVTFGSKQLKLIQIEDVTERVNFEKHRMEVINSIQDDERQNFAMELHDGLAQEMVLINLYLQQVKRSASDSSEFDKIEEIVQSAMTQIRRLTYSVTPPLLDDGFFEGLKVLFERFDSVNDMKISLSLNNIENLPEKGLPQEKGYNAFRIIQEFLNNSIKHSQASTIESVVNISDKNIVITIEDNGVGFDQKTVLKKGMGLGSMKKRAELFDLKFDFFSEKGKGTKLQLEINCEGNRITALEE